MDCWEFQRCGREKGGAKEKELGLCPAWPNDGGNCARVGGTLCGGEVQGSFAKKFSNCMMCDFYQSPDHLKPEEALKESEARYHSLFELSWDAILAVNAEGRFTDANPAALRLLGYMRQDLLELNYQRITPARWHSMNAAILREQVPTRGYSDEYEMEYVRKDGTIIPVSLRAFLRKDLAGHSVGAWAIVRDMTERKHAEEALRRNEAHFRALIEKSSDMIVVLDADARIQFWSASASQTLGWSAQEVLGQSRFEFIHPDDRSRLTAKFQELLDAPGGTLQVTTRYQHKNGSWRLIDTFARNLLHDQAVAGIVLNTRDVTDQRRLEEQLQQAQKLDGIGRLAGGVAHDFNNLLTVILSCAETLQEDVRRGSPASLEEIDEIRAAGERARELTRQLLAFARKQVIAPVSLDLNGVVRNSERLLRRVLGEDVELVTRFHPDLWTVRCDPGQTEQVILNLAVNARDAMPGGGKLTIETANVQIDESDVASYPFMRVGSHVQLTIRDSGLGMSPEVKARIFEPFFTTKSAGKGTGLGLAMAYGIVKQSGGYILVESEPGHGTRFKIFFPRNVDATIAVPTPTSPRSAARGTETVLVVEDDPQVREVTVRTLRAGGYRVVAASNGREALDLAERDPGPLHLLVTDIVMPGMTGREVADELRRRQAELRVLFVSGYTQDAIAQRGVLETGIEFLPKPFAASSLLARIRQVLDTR
jgi:two-component system, cell cycle sensor histidine kinase and response regulator CckA